MFCVIAFVPEVACVSFGGTKAPEVHSASAFSQAQVPSGTPEGGPPPVRGWVRVEGALYEVRPLVHLALCCPQRQSFFLFSSCSSSRMQISLCSHLLFLPVRRQVAFDLAQLLLLLLGFQEWGTRAEDILVAALMAFSLPTDD